MSIGESLAVICADAIVREEQRTAVLQRLRESGRDVLTLSFDQLEAFAGNMLELQAADGSRIFAMSQQALNSLNEQQRDELHANGDVLAVAIGAIEVVAGGSVRCMLAEVHLPRENRED